jgi:hypothetical protein
LVTLHIAVVSTKVRVPILEARRNIAGEKVLYSGAGQPAVEIRCPLENAVFPGEASFHSKVGIAAPNIR